jgi:hypothetical protein
MMFNRVYIFGESIRLATKSIKKLFDLNVMLQIFCARDILDDKILLSYLVFFLCYILHEVSLQLGVGILVLEQLFLSLAEVILQFRYPGSELSNPTLCCCQLGTLLAKAAHTQQWLVSRHQCAGQARIEQVMYRQCTVWQHRQ